MLAALSGIGSVMAAAPTVVSDVAASMTSNGGIAVSWSPVDDAVSYNVYYSRQSILQNGGDYDDFESTLGAETTYVFANAPQASGTLYVAVLAVSASGEESEGFATEASVVIGSAPVASSSMAISSSAPQMTESSAPTTTTQPMQYQTVQAISNTGVILMFTKDLSADAINAGYFVITDTGGTILPITEVLRDGSMTLLLKTAPQAPKKQYILGLVQNIKAADGTSMTVSTPRALFDGYTDQMQSSSVSSDTTGGGYVRNPALGSSSSSAPAFTGPSLVDAMTTKESNGTYTVRVTWTPAAGAVSYVLYTAQGDGEFTQTGTAGADQTSAQLRKVTAKNLRVKVTAKNAAGQESAGTVKEVPFSTGTSTPLPQSGIPVLGAVLIAGAFAGRRLSLRKKA